LLAVECLVLAVRCPVNAWYKTLLQCVIVDVQALTVSRVNRAPREMLASLGSSVHLALLDPAVAKVSQDYRALLVHRASQASLDRQDKLAALELLVLWDFQDSQERLVQRDQLVKQAEWESVEMLELLDLLDRLDQQASWRANHSCHMCDRLYNSSM